MRRVFLLFITFLLLISALSLSAYAADEVAPYASFYLSSYSVSASRGDAKGELVISYAVNSNTKATSIGVDKIEIYNSSGTKIATIFGSLSNGLQASSTSAHFDDYSYYGVSGAFYYAKVTVFAENASGSDSRTLTTSTVQVP